MGTGTHQDRGPAAALPESELRAEMVRLRQHDQTRMSLLPNPLQRQASGSEFLLQKARWEIRFRELASHGL